MENTTLLIDEKEKENAKALTQSFTKSDVKSRAYVNALGAETCLKYLKEAGINSEVTYNMHSIRKILEEFDISDVMLSNIHIDVRVVYNENEIFIPKAHFDYNIVPDIYVVLKINNNYSETEFLGFFEPKMINKNNSNDKYFFIEKEKLSSPSDFKNYVENYKGNTDSYISDSDAENAEVLMVAMSDHNISDDEKKTLLGYLKSNSELRDKFIEFESFEMLSYQAANSDEMETLISSSIQDNSEAVIEPIEDISAEEAFTDEMLAAPDSNELVDNMNEFESAEAAIESEMVSDVLDEFSNISEDNIEESCNSEEKEDNNSLGSLLMDGAVGAAEIAGAAVTSAAIAGAVDATEIVKDTAETVESAMDIVDSIEEFSKDENQNIESSASDGLIDNIDVSSEIQDSDNLFADINEFSGGLDVLENDNNEITDNQDEHDLFLNNEDFSIEENSSEADITYSDNVENVSDENNFEINNNDFDFEFSNNDDVEYTDNNEFNDLVFEDNSENDISYSDSLSNNIDSNSEKPVISTVVNTPISEATDLVSMESIQAKMLENIEVPETESGDLMETMEMDEFQELVDNYVPQEFVSQSETSEYDDIVNTVDKNNVNPMVPNDIETSIYSDVDTSNSDAYTQDMPEEVEQRVPDANDNLSSEDFVQDMPEEIEQKVHDVNDDLNSENFIQDMPEEVKPMEHEPIGNPDDYVQDLSEVMNAKNIDQTTFENVALQDAVAEENDVISKGFSEQFEVPEDSIEDDMFDQDMLDAADAVKLNNDMWNLDIEGLSNNANLPKETIQEDSAVAEEEILDTENHEEVSEIANNEEELFQEDNVAEEENLDTENHEEVSEIADNEEELFQEDNVAEEEISNIQSHEETVSELDDEEKFSQELDEMHDFDAEPKDIRGDFENITEIDNIEDLEGIENINEDSSLGVLYSSDNAPEQMVSPIADELIENENEDFKPKKNYILIPIVGALIVTLITGSVVGIMMKSKNSVESDTLIQTSPENGTLASPETDNSGVLSNEGGGILPAVPEDAMQEEPKEANVVAPTENENKISQAKKQEAIKNTKEAIKKTNEVIKQQTDVVTIPKKPLNANKTISLKKVSWEVPNYLSYSDNIKSYLQTAGKSIKLTLSSDLLLTNDYIYSNRVKINLKLDNTGKLLASQITQTSGSTQVDKIVLQTVKETLNVVKPIAGEVPTPTYNLGIIIYL